MATQRDVQQLIQSLVPGSVNNGNPNTVYNTGAPSMDTNGNWFASNLPDAASVNALTRGATPMPGQWVAPTGSDTMLGGPMQMPTLGTWTPPSGWVPPSNPAGGGGGGGAVQRPPTGTPFRPATGNPSRPGTRATMMPDPVGTFSPGIGSFAPRGFDGLGFGGSVGSARGFGSTGGGGDFAWQQILDAFIPGDAYLTGTGNWDMSNIATGLLQKFVGMPIANNPFLALLQKGLGLGSFDDALTRLGKYGIEHGWSENHPAVNHVVDQIMDRLAKNQKDIIKMDEKRREAYFDAVTRDILKKAGNPMMSKQDALLEKALTSNSPVGALNSMGVGGNYINNLLRQTGSSATKLSPKSIGALGAGAGVIEGQAARDFVDNMKLSTAHKSFQSGTGASIFGGGGTFKK